MNEPTIEQIRAELASVLTGQRFGKIFPLSRFLVAVDFRLPDSQFLLLGVEPAAPRVYLVKRRLRDLEKQSEHSHSFVLVLRKRLANAVLQTIEKIAGERILLFDFSGQNELGQTEKYTLAAQLTGRSANLLLLDKNSFIVDKMRETFGPGQEIGDLYAPPRREKKVGEMGERGDTETRRRGDTEIFSRGEFQTLSEALDNFYLEKEAEKIFQNRAKAARNRIKQELSKREKLVKKLERDLAEHGDAERWKRSGDLILANLADAVREDGKVLVVDYFDEQTPAVEIEIDENDSLTEAAEKFFRRYTKARNANTEISRRLTVLEAEISSLKLHSERLNEAIRERDEDFLREFLGDEAPEISKRPKKQPADKFSGARLFASSEGFEILVGKGARDNDFLTFRVARSLDLWLHAADYPGSHVVVRNPSRGEIPQKTLLEAAQIAAFYSQARAQPKVAVHYTQKKFVNKPRGAAPGLVSLSSFKTILVEPKIFNNG